MFAYIAAALALLALLAALAPKTPLERYILAALPADYLSADSVAVALRPGSVRVSLHGVELSRYLYELIGDCLPLPHDLEFLRAERLDATVRWLPWPGASLWATSVRSRARPFDEARLDGMLVESVAWFKSRPAGDADALLRPPAAAPAPLSPLWRAVDALLCRLQLGFRDVELEFHGQAGAVLTELSAGGGRPDRPLALRGLRVWAGSRDRLLLAPVDGDGVLALPAIFGELLWPAPLPAKRLEVRLDRVSELALAAEPVQLAALRAVLAPFPAYWAWWARCEAAAEAPEGAPLTAEEEARYADLARLPMADEAARLAALAELEARVPLSRVLALRAPGATPAQIDAAANAQRALRDLVVRVASPAGVSLTHGETALRLAGVFFEFAMPMLVLREPDERTMAVTARVQRVSLHHAAQPLLDTRLTAVSDGSSMLEVVYETYGDEGSSLEADLRRACVQLLWGPLFGVLGSLPSSSGSPSSSPEVPPPQSSDLLIAAPGTRLRYAVRLDDCVTCLLHGEQGLALQVDAALHAEANDAAERVSLSVTDVSLLPCRSAASAEGVTVDVVAHRSLLSPVRLHARYDGTVSAQQGVVQNVVLGWSEIEVSLSEAHAAVIFGAVEEAQASSPPQEEAEAPQQEEKEETDNFARLDLDGDGQLTHDEIRQLLAAHAPHLTTSELSDETSAFMQAADRNADGHVDRAEFRAAFEERAAERHAGAVVLHNREYHATPEFVAQLLDGHATVEAALLARAELGTAWGWFEAETGASRTSLAGQPPATVQAKMVRAYRDYRVAKDLWALVVVPSLLAAEADAADLGWRLRLDDENCARIDVQAAVAHPRRPTTTTTTTTSTTTTSKPRQLKLDTEMSAVRVRLMDPLLAASVPRVVLELAEVQAYLGYRGSTANGLRLDDTVTGTLSFIVDASYYNSTSRAMEPVLEPWHLDVLLQSPPRDPSLDLTVRASNVLQLNVTAPLMDSVGFATELAAVLGGGRAATAATADLWVVNETGETLALLLPGATEPIPAQPGQQHPVLLAAGGDALGVNGASVAVDLLGTHVVRMADGRALAATLGMEPGLGARLALHGLVTVVNGTDAELPASLLGRAPLAVGGPEDLDLPADLVAWDVHAERGGTLRVELRPRHALVNALPGEALGVASGATQAQTAPFDEALAPPGVIVDRADDETTVLRVTHWVVNETGLQFRFQPGVAFGDRGLVLRGDKLRLMATGMRGQQAALVTACSVPGAALPVPLRAGSLLFSDDSGGVLLGAPGFANVVTVRLPRKAKGVSFDVARAAVVFVLSLNWEAADGFERLESTVDSSLGPMSVWWLAVEQPGRVEIKGKGLVVAVCESSGGGSSGESLDGHIEPPLSLQWSDDIAVGAVGTTGRVTLGDETLELGVTISPLPALFCGTKVVTLSPGVVVQSRLPVGVRVGGAWARPTGRTTTSVRDRVRARMASWRSASSRGNTWAGDAVELAPGEQVALYAFGSQAAASASPEQRKSVVIDDGAVVVAVEDLGDHFHWSRDLLLHCSVQLVGATTFVTLSDASLSPPFCVENRSPSHTLAVGDLVIPPLTWHSLAHGGPELEVAVLGGEERERRRYDIDTIGPKKRLAAGLKVAVVPRGPTRVLSVMPVHAKPPSVDEKRLLQRLRRHRGDRGDRGDRGEEEDEDEDDEQDLFSSLACTVDLAGFALALIDSQPQELLLASVDRVRLLKRAQSRQIDLTVFHAQVDNMLEGARFPVVLAPADTGFHSGRHERAHRKDFQPVPLLQVSATLLPRDGIVHFDELHVALGSLDVRADVGFWTGPMLELLGRLAGPPPVAETQEGAREEHEGTLAFCQLLVLESLQLHVEVDVGQHSWGSGLGVSRSLWQLGCGPLVETLKVVGSSFAHISPTLSLAGLEVRNSFGPASLLCGSIGRHYAQQLMRQSYKLLGSVELLGNPVGLVSALGTGVLEFVRETGAELIGRNRSHGEGVRRLVQGVVGGTASSAAKVTSSLAHFVAGATSSGAADLEEDEAGVAHLAEGVAHGGEVLGRAIFNGVTGLWERPLEGARRGGVGGLAKGVAKGIMGVVAAPVVGTLGAATTIAEGVEASTHMFDGAVFAGRRRPPRIAGRAPLVALPPALLLLRRFEVTVRAASVAGADRAALSIAGNDRVAGALPLTAVFRIVVMGSRVAVALSHHRVVAVDKVLAMVEVDPLEHLEIGGVVSVSVSVGGSVGSSGGDGGDGGEVDLDVVELEFRGLEDEALEG